MKYSYTVVILLSIGGISTTAATDTNNKKRLRQRLPAHQQKDKRGRRKLQWGSNLDSFLGGGDNEETPPVDDEEEEEPTNPFPFQAFEDFFEEDTYWPTYSPTLSSSENESIAPENIPLLQYIGDDYAEGTYGECQGDCDTDADCNSPDLVCFHRYDDDGDVPWSVPGCDGSPATPDTDYCVVRTSDIIFTHDESYTGTLGKCEGSCDTDDDCAGDLVCQQRIGTWDIIVGCAGWGEGGVSYCREPTDVVPQEEVDDAAPTVGPSKSPSMGPSTSPTPAPSSSPSMGPSTSPTPAPSSSPSTSPTTSPSLSPTPDPTKSPSSSPTSKVISKCEWFGCLNWWGREPTQLPKPGDEDVPITDAPTPAVETTSSPTTSGIPGDEDVPVTDAPTPVPTNTPTNKPTNVKAETTLINFDDVTTSGYESISNGYKGLNWNEFSVISKDYYAESGFAWGTVSGQYIAFYTGGSDSKYGTITSSGSPFAVSGFSATAAWETGVTVLVEGFDSSGNLIDSHQKMLGSPRNGATYIDLSGGNFEGLSELKISSSGGTSINLRGEGPWLGIDNLQVAI